jgi:anti-anti-sigma regulatory factor
VRHAGGSHRRDLEFTEGIATIRLHGDASLAARELDEVWLPLLMTGHQKVIVILDGVNRLDAEVISALERVLTHVRGVGGEMALVTSRPEFVEALQALEVEPAVPVLLDVDSATTVFQEREVSIPIGEQPLTPPGAV